MTTQVATSPSSALFSVPEAVEPADFYGASTVPEALARSARTDKGIILVDGALAETRLSYRELDASARSIAAALHATGVAPGDRVCLLSGTDESLLRTLFGVWYAGAVPVMLPLPRRRGDLEEFLDDIGRRVAAVDARLLAVTDAYVDVFAPLAGPRCRVAPLGALADLGRAPSAPQVEPPSDPSAVALLQFTSGTTQSSRAVVLTHHNVLSNMAAVWHSYGIGPEETGMTWLPLNHDMGIIGLLGCVARGNDVVVQSPEHFISSPMSWLTAISRYRVSLTVAPNFAYALAGRLLRGVERKLDLSCLKWAVNGAEPIDVESLESFTAAAARYGMRPTVPCPVFGLAEATLCVTLRPSDAPLAVRWVDREALETEGRAVTVPEGAPGGRRLVACGAPIPGTRVSIRDEDGTELPHGRVGAIHVQGPCVMSGYWNDPAATAAVMQDGWLDTGDLGFVGDEGLVICGRRKDMIILGGRNIYPEDFETEAERVEGVRHGNTIAFLDPAAERMVLVVEGRVSAADAPDLAARLIERLRKRLPVPPHEVVVCPASTLPKTTSGKRRRGRCREMYLDGSLPVLARAMRSSTGVATSTERAE
ncbi:AMP-binding protein [Streptomyces vietnamensis]|uniref:AMP-binding protein n=1 Tax=Streptomyces vietnamensis TaxID=362257 RepID=UPI0037A90C08